MKRKTIALITQTSVDNNQNLLMAGIEKAAEELDVNFIRFASRVYLNDYQINENQITTICTLAKKMEIDGLMFLGWLGNLKPDFLKGFPRLFHPTPVMSIGKIFDNIPSIYVQGGIYIQDLVEHLVREHHYQRILFIHPFEEDDRIAAYRTTMEKHGIFDPAYMLLPEELGGRCSLEARAERIVELIEKKKLAPQAVISLYSHESLELLGHFKKKGIRVPHDVALTTYEDSYTVKFADPPLTTILYPWYELGDAACRKIFEIMNGTHEVTHTAIPAKLIIRKSCGCTSRHFKRFFSDPAPGKDVSLFSLPEKEKSELNRRLQEKLTVLKAERCCESFLSDLENPEGQRFLSDIESQGDDAELNDEILSLVQDDVTAFAAFVLPFLKRDKEKLILAETLVNQARIYLEEEIQFQKGKKETEINKNPSLFQEMSQEIITSFHMEKSLEIIAQYLPLFQIHDCLIYLYENETRPADGHRLVFAFKDGKRINLKNAEHAAVSSRIPGTFYQSKSRRTVLVQLLHINDEPIGFILFRLGSKDERIYHSISFNLSSAIKGWRIVLELEKAYTDLEAFDERKTHFFVNFAHEMKTPLTLIKNYTRRFTDKYSGDHDFLVITSNIEKLERDITNFLDMQKLERGSYIFDHSRVVPLSDMVTQKAALFGELSRKKNISLRLKMEDNIHVRFDPFAVDSILNNLLDNALKYTPSGGLVEIRVNRNHDDLFISVRDNGIGIAKQYHRQIFRPYYQVSPGEKGSQGMGMGLAFVQRIVEEAGGTVSVESKKNAGTTLTVHLKNIVCNGREAAVPAGREEIPVPAEPSPVFELARETYDESKKNVFIIDDNVGILVLLQTDMRDTYNVFCAQSGIEALRKIEQIPKPDLIISDIMMDRVNGYQVFQAISSHEKFKDVPFLFLTALTSKDKKLEGLRLGAIDYISKPFDSAELLAKVHSLLHSYESQKETSRHEFVQKLDHFMKKEFNSRDDNENLKDTFFKARHVSRKEIEVITLLAEGYQYKEICYRLNISMNTLKTHVKNIYGKLRVDNRIELVNLIKTYQ